MSKEAQRMIRPQIPREWQRPNFLGFVYYAVYAWAFVIGFGYMSYVIATGEVYLLVKIPLLLVSLFLASNGYHLLGWFGHDGIHLNLLDNKYASVLAGMLFSAASFFPLIGYGVSHWNHHRFTNQKSDPDANIYPKFKGLLSRLLLGRITANRRYTSITVKLALGIPVDPTYRLPFSDRWLRVFSILNLLLFVFWFAVIVSICQVNFSLGLYAVILPLLMMIPITGIRFYLEHTSTGAGIFRDTRTYSHPVYTFLLFGNNMHLEHHLYPHVPSYHLAKVHWFLKSQGYYERWNSHIVEGFFEAWEFATGKHQYPEPLIDDLEADPFARPSEG